MLCQACPYFPKPYFFCSLLHDKKTHVAIGYAYLFLIKK
jgi:hypothetical protein